MKKIWIFNIASTDCDFKSSFLLYCEINENYKLFCPYFDEIWRKKRNKNYWWNFADFRQFLGRLNLQRVYSDIEKNSYVLTEKFLSFALLENVRHRNLQWYAVLLNNDNYTHSPAINKIIIGFKNKIQRTLYSQFIVSNNGVNHRIIRYFQTKVVHISSCFNKKMRRGRTQSKGLRKKPRAD